MRLHFSPLWLCFVFATFNNFRYAKPFASIEKPHFEDIYAYCIRHDREGGLQKVFQYPHPMYVYSSYWDQYDWVSWRWMRSGGKKHMQQSLKHTDRYQEAHMSTHIKWGEKASRIYIVFIWWEQIVFPFLSHQCLFYAKSLNNVGRISSQ